jgi:hypothetical protein
VSEGEIRAFRDGQSMKFKREDIDSLRPGLQSDEELSFADVLEDDTGRVTEELTEEETLLAEDDLIDDEPGPVSRTRRDVVATARRTRTTSVEPAAEPAWVTVVAVASAVVLLYGLMVIWNIAAEQAPSGITGIFAGS